jgi:hypothetical protein
VMALARLVVERPVLGTEPGACAEMATRACVQAAGDGGAAGGVAAKIRCGRPAVMAPEAPPKRLEVLKPVRLADLVASWASREGARVGAGVPRSPDLPPPRRRAATSSSAQPSMPRSAGVGAPTDGRAGRAQSESATGEATMATIGGWRRTMI